MLRCIREIKPRYVVGENVFGIVNWNGGLVFDEVQADLEAEGYEVQAFVLPACAVNAPHRRDRVWFVAYSGGTRTGNKRKEFNGQGRESGSNRKPSIYENGAVGTSGHNAASSNDGIASNANSEQCSSRGTSEEIERIWSGNDGEQETGGESSERFDRLSGLQWDAADATSEGREERQQVGGRTYSAENRTRLVNGIERPVNDGDVANAGASEYRDSQLTPEQAKSLDKGGRVLRRMGTLGVLGNGTDSLQLNPQFVGEMMGFTPDWMVLPFLNGEQKV